LEGIKIFVAVVTIKAFLCPQEEIKDNNFSRVITSNKCRNSDQFGT
jgi:hypothetical protein